MNTQSRIKTALMAVAATATLLLALPSQAGDYHHQRGHDHRYCQTPHGWHGGGYRQPYGYDRHARYDRRDDRDWRRDGYRDGRRNDRRNDYRDDRRYGR